jgi:hypothetical protein
MERRPRSRSSPLTLQSSHTSSFIMIIHHLLHLHRGQAITLPMMTHQHGACFPDDVDLHLGQKPKLGGEVRWRFTHLPIIFFRSFVYPCFAFFIVLVLISSFQNTKRPKIFPLFLFVCLFSFLVLVCFVLYFRFEVWKIQKYFALFAISFVLVLKIKNPKIFVVLLRFCKVCCRVQSPVTPLDLGIHFILFKPHKWKGSSDDIWQSEMW